MCFRILTVLFLFIGLNSVKSQEVKAPAFGKGILNLVGKDSTWSMNVSGRMQFLGIGQWSENDNEKLSSIGSNFLIRRGRLKFKGFAYSPKLKYKVELGLSNRDISGASEFTHDAPRYILDAFVMWNFYENFELWIGQTKLPGNIERIVSSANMQLVDRSLLNNRFTIDRDMGAQLRHKFYLSDKFLIREAFALSQGEGRNVSKGNLGGYQYTTRLELLPFGAFTGNTEYVGSDLKREQSPKLLLGVAYDANKNAVKTRSNQGDYMFTDTGFYETDINTLFVNAIFKYNGFSFLGEYADRKADNAIAVNKDGTATGDVVQVGKGLNLMSGYVFKNNLEITGRYTSVELDKQITNENKENQYTFGVSKYLVGHKLKVQTDATYLTEVGGPDGLIYRLQLEVHF
ncbi:MULTISPECIES: porin [unclassified Cellulophaga]|uniref:porin n=1 Tax=unclassified Cellulophaga TaxID=2634405 RepID=UPI0026E28730|nr:MULTISPECIES: porin [unclassified Cellulophaga]MDO6490039.1 porin [Cellulophaga sp. 2_MG-2023]MDO6494767.1 porin [Cellulophaga sp. 3_MG-2023]